MDPEEIKGLRKRDPFMFYSLPLVGRAAMRLEDVDRSSVVQADQARRHFDPTSSDGSKKLRRSSAFRRSRRISFEAHPDTIMGFDEEFDFDEGEDDDEDDLDILLGM